MTFDILIAVNLLPIHLSAHFTISLEPNVFDQSDLFELVK